MTPWHYHTNLHLHQVVPYNLHLGKAHEIMAQSSYDSHYIQMPILVQCWPRFHNAVEIAKDKNSCHYKDSPFPSVGLPQYSALPVSSSSALP